MRHCLARIVGRRFRGVGRLLLQDPPDGRLADVDTCPGQLVGDLRFAERRAEQLDLLDGIANEIRKSIHRRSGLNQRVIVGSPEPRSDRVIGDEEAASRFRFAPASHRPQFQDGHPFNRRVLRSSVRGDTLHPGAVDPQFLSQHGKFGFQLVDSCLFHIAFLDQGFAASEHGDAHDPDDIQYRISNE